MTAITIKGNLATDPELRYVPNGKPVATIIVLENRRVRQGGEWTDAEPNRFEVEVWDHQAQNVADSLTKGSPVVVVGNIITKKWTKDGENRTRQILRAELVGHSLARHTVTATRSVAGDADSTTDSTDPWEGAQD